MTEEPSQTEWMDLEPYPGPNQHTLMEELAPFTNQVLLVSARMYKELERVVLEAFRGVELQVVGMVDEINRLNEKLEPNKLPIKDRDKPAGFPGRNPHGPYEGSRYNQHGRKSY